MPKTPKMPNPPEEDKNYGNALRGVGATIPTSPLPARRLHGLTGRRGGFALSFYFKMDRNA